MNSQVGKMLKRIFCCYTLSKVKRLKAAKNVLVKYCIFKHLSVLLVCRLQTIATRLQRALKVHHTLKVRTCTQLGVKLIHSILFRRK